MSSKVAIICTGALAPGMNGVIAAVTLRAHELGWDVIGFHDGFTHLAELNVENLRANTVELTPKLVVPIHISAGSILRTARYDPISNSSTEHDAVDHVITNLRTLGVSYFIVVGGNKNMYAAHAIAQNTTDIKVVVIPKTIDNDVPLTGCAKTFGYETARVFGMDLVKNLIAETRSVPRWFIVEIMGNLTGHLAFSVAASTSASLSVIPEDFLPEKVTLEEVCDVVEAAILKRAATGYEIGTCVISEGVISKLTPESQEILFCDKDRTVLDGAELGRAISNMLRDRCAARKLSFRFCPKKFGYELRGAQPTSGDCMLAKELGDGAVEALQAGKTDVMVEWVQDDIVFTPIQSLIEGSKIRTRYVNTKGREYKTVKRYQFNIRPEDLENKELVEKMAAIGHYTQEEFLAKFKHAASLLVPIQ